MREAQSAYNTEMTDFADNPAESNRVLLRVNGDALELAPGATLATLLTQLGLAAPRVAVEVNEQLVRRGAFEHTPLRSGDRVEIVTLVGGG